MRKIVAINGSERGSAGTTYAVLEHCKALAAQRGFEFEIVNLVEYKFSSCGPCGDCNTRRSMCTVDDEAPKIVGKLLDASGVIYASPVQGYGTVPLMASFIERIGVGYLRFGRQLTNKVGAAIVVGRRYGQTSVYNHLMLNLLLNRMIVAGSGFPAIMYAGSPSEIYSDEEGIDMVNRTIERMIDLAELLETHERLTGAPVLPASTDNERSRIWAETAGDRNALHLPAVS